MHIVSQVEGELAPEHDGIDLLKSTFPAGTVAGAPKVRAMEIIEELEPTRRGPYAGAVGYLSFSGNLDFCITIRSFTIHQGQVYLQVGAGIVADSDPPTEFEETVNKGHGPDAGPGPGGGRVDVRIGVLGEPRFCSGRKSRGSPKPPPGKIDGGCGEKYVSDDR